MPNLILQDKFYNKNKIDQYQEIFTQLIVNEFFSWTCLVLILTYKKWKKYIVMLMVVHYLLRCIGDMFEKCLNIFEQDYTRWPFGNSQWIKSYGIASIFWHSSEIIGDWYLLIRTKTIIKNNNKIVWVYATCIIYNLVKCTQIYSFMSYVPFREGFDQADPETQNAYYALNMADFKAHKWTNVALQQICSLAYELSVFIILKKYVFNDKESLKLIDINGNSFLKKFKQISEYRIILSVLITICGIPLIFTYAFYVFYYDRTTTTMDSQEKINTVHAMIDDSIIDPIRTLILNFSYIFMYVDQVILREYVNKQKSTKKCFNIDNSNSYKIYINQYNSSYSNCYSFKNINFQIKNTGELQESLHNITLN
ncbi:hypothetical protein PIROE2DRAFT_59717 [Piromyces sp. E2]|nr:hypothetical protein PIROE2DRAFT_59717 [Piromyces sp. E2]|eukprot:OUM65863.1 hypothetical protein PIROE2DRAFT_59717 [Piromyces sp. E2]